MTDKDIVALIALVEQRLKEISAMQDSVVFRAYELNILIRYIIDKLKDWKELSESSNKE